VRVTHYALGRKRCLSKSGPGGNSAGNFRPRSAKALNPLRNSTELDSSPGHQVDFLHVFQRLPSSRSDSNFGAHHR